MKLGCLRKSNCESGVIDFLIFYIVVLNCIGICPLLKENERNIQENEFPCEASFPAIVQNIAVKRKLFIYIYTSTCFQSSYLFLSHSEIITIICRYKLPEFTSIVLLKMLTRYIRKFMLLTIYQYFKNFTYGKSKYNNFL